MSGNIYITEIIRNRSGKAIDAKVSMDGFRGFMSPESLVAINERNPGTVVNLCELFMGAE